MQAITLIFTLLISTAAFGFDFASPKGDSAKLVLSYSVAAKQIYPVRLTTINGENVDIQTGAVWLKPGEYQLGFASLLNVDYAHQVFTKEQRRGLNQDNNNLQVQVTADKTYYIGFDASSAEQKDWQVVVYDVK